MHIRTHILFCISLLTSLWANGQSKVNYGYFNHWTEDDGLSNNDVRAFAEDSLGYFWIGTWHGLNRFDGKNFKAFHTESSSSSLIGNKINDLFVSSDNVLWIATENGVCSYDINNDTFRQYPNVDNNGNSLFRAEVVIPGDDGFIYCCYESLTPSIGGISQLNPKTGEHKNFLPEDNPGAWDISFEKENPDILWGIGDNCLTKVNIETGEFEFFTEGLFALSGFDSEFVMSYDQDQLLIGTSRHGVCLYNTKTQNYISHNTGNLIRDFEGYNGEYLFVSYSKGLGLINPESGEHSFWNHQNGTEFGIPKQNPRVVKVDGGSRVWVGHKDGFSILNPRFQLIKNKNFTADLNIGSENGLVIQGGYLNSEENELVFAEHQKHGLQRVDINSFEIIDSVKYFLNGSFKGELIDAKQFQYYKKDSVLMLTNLGLLALNINDFRTRIIYEFKDKKVKKRWFDYDVENGLMVFSYGIKRGKFLFVDLKNDLEFKVTLPSLYQGTNYPRMPQIRNSKVWLQTYSYSGFYDLTTGSLVPITDLIDGLDISEFPFIGNTLFYSDSIIYLTTQLNGLMEIDLSQRSYKYLPQEYDYPTFWGADVLKDQEGYVWVSSSQGLLQYDPIAHEFTCYNKDYGLQFNNWYWSKMFKTSTDRVIGVRYANLFYTDLNELKKQNIESSFNLDKIRISGVELISDKHLANVDEVRLPYGPLNLSFDFVNLIPNRIRSIDYCYKLAPLETSWNYIGEFQTGFYQNLEGGEYELYISSNFDQKNEKEPYMVKIYVQTKFVSTIWFKILLGLVLMIIIYSIHKFRLNETHKKLSLQKEFDKKLAEVEMTALRAQMNPHFLFNSLNSIKYYIIKNKTDEASDYLTKFSRLMRLILNNSKSKLVSLESELESLDLYIQMEQLRFEEGFNYVIDIDKNIDILNVFIPPLLLQPYVENSIWHGLLHKDIKGNLKIVIAKNNDRLICVIEDDGIGREKAAELKSKTARKDQSFGMKITSRRIDYINELYQTNAEFKIVDLTDNLGEPSGTKVCLTIPILDEIN